VISVTSGGTFSSSGSSTKLSGFLTNSDANTVGQNTNATGALSVVRTSTTTYLIGQSVAPSPNNPAIPPIQIQLPTNIQVNRVTWTQLR
jgi:hypothetical protein